MDHDMAAHDKYFGAHEFQPREEAVKTSTNRNFGLVFAAFFALLAAGSFWRGTERWPIWLGAACVPLVLAFAAPTLLTPFNWVWTKFGLLLHQIISPVFLALIFYGCVTPVGFLMRLSGKDPLRRKYEPAAETYWIKRTPPGPTPQSFKDQF
jgi:hypothetical protein